MIISLLSLIWKTIEVGTICYSFLGMVWLNFTVDQFSNSNNDKNKNNFNFFAIITPGTTICHTQCFRRP